MQVRAEAMVYSEFFSLPCDWVETKTVMCDDRILRLIDGFNIERLNMTGPTRFYSHVEGNLQLLPAPSNEHGSRLVLEYLAEGREPYRLCWVTPGTNPRICGIKAPITAGRLTPTGCWRGTPTFISTARCSQLLVTYRTTREYRYGRRHMVRPLVLPTWQVTARSILGLH